MGEFMSRRAALRSAGALGLAAVAGRATAADVPPGRGPGKAFFHAGALQVVPVGALTAKGYVADVSEDGLNVGALYDEGLQLTLGGDKDPAMTAVRVGTLCIPFTLPDDYQLVGFVQDIQGTVTKTMGARIALVADLGGTTETLDFPYDKPIPGGGEDFTFQVCSLERRPVVPVGVARPAVPHYALNLFLTAQRRTRDDQALIHVSSTSTEAIVIHRGAAKARAAPPKKKKR